MKRILSLLACAAAALVLTVCANAAEAEPVQWNVAASGMVQVGDTIYLADSYLRAVWAVEDDAVTHLAGRIDVTDSTGRPVAGYYDGAFDEAVFGEPWALAVYGDGLLVSDPENHVVRYMDLEERQVYTAVTSGLDMPTGLAVDDAGTVYIADTARSVILSMDQTGKITTYAGAGEGCALGTLREVRFCEPTGLCWDDGVLYVCDTGNHRVVALADGQATLVAGASLEGDAAESGDYRNDKAAAARFSSPQGVAVDGDVIYVADTGNGAIRIIRDGYVTTLDKADSGRTYPISPRGLLVDGERLYVGDVFSRTLLAYTPDDAKGGFTDVTSGGWYYDAVRFVSANGLFQGTGAGQFSPDAAMTRAMFLTVLARYEGVDTTDGETWYAVALDWAVESGVSDGSHPTQNLTREQLATMLYRFAGSPAVHGTLDGFTDTSSVSSWAKDAVSWAVEEGLMEGVGGSRLSPGGAATRAQVAAIFQRYLS